MHQKKHTDAEKTPVICSMPYADVSAVSFCLGFSVIILDSLSPSIKKSTHLLPLLINKPLSSSNNSWHVVYFFNHLTSAIPIFQPGKSGFNTQTPYLKVHIENHRPMYHLFVLYVLVKLLPVSFLPFPELYSSQYFHYHSLL